MRLADNNLIKCALNIYARHLRGFEDNRFAEDLKRVEELKTKEITANDDAVIIDLVTNIEKAIDMKKVDDLSFSGIVNLIQGDEIEGADLLVQIAKEREQLEVEIEQEKKKLHQLKTRCNLLKNGASYVLKHLEKKSPLAVQRQGFIVVVTERDISIERNVL